jgi:threonine/homoserine/homoserine lactone efflux protein
MNGDLIIKGYIMGFLISLPIGPIAILIIQRTANKSFKSGIYTALGAVTADTIYALVAGFSLSYIITFLREYQTILQIIGAAVLFFLGFYIFRVHPLNEMKDYKRKGNNYFQCYGTALLFTLSNPLIVLAYIAVFAGTGVVFNIKEIFETFFFIAGFSSGALSWWLILTSTINYFRHRFNLRILWWFNKISGTIIMIFVFVTTIFALLKGTPKI